MFPSQLSAFPCPSYDRPRRVLGRPITGGLVRFSPLGFIDDRQVLLSDRQTDKQSTMADRGWFGRGRSAHTAQQPAQVSNVTSGTQSEAGDQAPPASLHRSFTQVPLQQSHPHKPPKLAKISSYMGLGALAKAQSPTVSMYPELIMERSDSMKTGANGHHVTSVDGGGPIGDWQPASRKEEFPFYNEAECTWHNPSLKQMVETVSCTIKKNGSSAPIPRHLNGWIAGIIEEVSHQTSELNGLRTQVAELKANRQEEVIEFTKVTEEWAQREMNFKAEINRLEHIISDTQQGAESVLLARAGSVVNRNDGRAFRAKLDRLSRSDEGKPYRAQFWPPRVADGTDTSLAEDGNALAGGVHPADRHREYLVEQDKRDAIALSPGDVGLTVNTTPYKILGAFDSCIPPLNVERKYPANNISHPQDPHLACLTIRTVSI